MKKLYILIVLFICQITFSQENGKKLSIPPISEAVYSIDQVSIKPEFKGGEKAWKSYIKKNFKIPNVASLKGNVLVSFIVEKNGTLTEIGVLQDVGHGTGDEAIRVMENSPVWLPGKLNESAVRTQYLVTIPINRN